MPTDSVKEEGTTNPSPAVSANDLKEFKDSLTSSVGSELQKMREMIAQLLHGQKGGVPPSSSNEDPIPPNADDAAAQAAAEAAAKDAEEDVGNEETSDSTKPDRKSVV